MGNQKKPIIGIVSKPVKYKVEPLWHYDELVDDLRFIMVSNGAIALGILPPSPTMEFNDNDDLDPTVLSKEELDDLYRVVDICNGIILEGGLTSSAYEVEVARYALQTGKPILGICAGFNNLIRAMGGNVKVDPTETHNIYSNKTAHSIQIEKGSRLHEILKTEHVMVNSIHVMVAHNADIKGLKPSAHSPDGLVEAVELEGTSFAMGIKWHPEIMLDENPKMNNIFTEFIKACMA